MSSSKNCDCAVLSYLSAQNRPYSTNDVVLNLHKEHGKAAVQRALDTLTLEGKVKEKVNGKQKAYVVQQEGLKEMTQEEMRESEEKMKKAESELKTLSDSAKSLEVESKQLLSHPTTQEALGQSEAIEKEIEGLRTKLDKIKGNGGEGKPTLVSKSEKASIESSHESSVKEWRRRKRLCLSIVDAIMESYPKSKKVLIEEIGMETDEEHGAKIPM